MSWNSFEWNEIKSDFLFYFIFKIFFNITINIKKCNKIVWLFYYWGAFCQGGFCPVPNLNKNSIYLAGWNTYTIVFNYQKNLEENTGHTITSETIHV